MYRQQAGAKGKALVAFFQWATSEGQKFAADRHYAPLPAELSKKVAEKLGAIEVK